MARESGPDAAIRAWPCSKAASVVQLPASGERSKEMKSVFFPEVLPDYRVASEISLLSCLNSKSIWRPEVIAPLIGTGCPKRCIYLERRFSC